MAKNEGLCKVFATNPGDWVDNLPNERTGTGKDMASIAENQCVTYNEIIEALDREEWNK